MRAVLYDKEDRLKGLHVDEVAMGGKTAPSRQERNEKDVHRNKRYAVHAALQLHKAGQ